MLALMFQIGQQRVALDVRQITEVAPRVPLQHAPGSPDWLAGTMVYRQSVVPVVDLYRLLVAGECPSRLSSRIIIVPWEFVPGTSSWLGLIAANVAEICDLPMAAGSHVGAESAVEADLGPAIVNHGEVVRLLDVSRLLPASVREHLAGACCS